jgi:hypothetical protein
VDIDSSNALKAAVIAKFRVRPDLLESPWYRNQRRWLERILDRDYGNRFTAEDEQEWLSGLEAVFIRRLLDTEARWIGIAALNGPVADGSISRRDALRIEGIVERERKRLQQAFYSGDQVSGELANEQLMRLLTRLVQDAQLARRVGTRGTRSLPPPPPPPRPTLPPSILSNPVPNPPPSIEPLSIPSMPITNEPMITVTPETVVTPSFIPEAPQAPTWVLRDDILSPVRPPPPPAAPPQLAERPPIQRQKWIESSRSANEDILRTSLEARRKQVAPEDEEFEPEPEPEIVQMQPATVPRLTSTISAPIRPPTASVTTLVNRITLPARYQVSSGGVYSQQAPLYRSIAHVDTSVGQFTILHVGGAHSSVPSPSVDSLIHSWHTGQYVHTSDGSIWRALR